MRKTQADELAARGNDVDIYQAPINTVWSLPELDRSRPSTTPDLRRAVNLAVDRQELVAKALEGAGVPCAILDPKLVGDFALPLDEVAKPPGCRQPKEQDIAEAKRLVEKHHPNGLDVEVAVRQVGNYVDRAQLVSPSSARSASAARSRPTRARRATRPSARATSPSSPPRTAPWTSPTRRIRSRSTRPRPAATTASTRIPRWTSWPTARCGVQSRQAQAALLGAAAAHPARARRLHPGGLGGGLVLQGQEAPQLQARRPPSTTTTPS